ncbi:hypothetical protein [Hyphomonas sp.]|uniref:hypothetical protein n=1 Tax=Hyphomonas sp. TaxID=87 RepID=UPI0025B90E9D|nr:hypothetical protein [Hyphomonas sp.]MBI1399605.1 hypothetical protein [Hyphomonas sp.]
MKQKNDLVAGTGAIRNDKVECARTPAFVLKRAFDAFLKSEQRVEDWTHWPARRVRIGSGGTAKRLTDPGAARGDVEGLV